MESNGEILVAYKDRTTGAGRGLIQPVLFMDSEGTIKSVPSSAFPSGVFIAKGYEAIDEAFGEKELFLVKQHSHDSEKSEQDGISRYWSKPEFICSLPPNSLLPVIQVALPPRETGELPDGITPPIGMFFIQDANDGKFYGPLNSTNSESGCIVEAAATPALSYGKDYLGVFQESDIGECVIRLHINGFPAVFLSSAKDLEGRHSGKVDYISDDKLVKYGNTLGVGRNDKHLSKREAEKLVQVALINRTPI